MLGFVDDTGKYQDIFYRNRAFICVVDLDQDVGGNYKFFTLSVILLQFEGGKFSFKEFWLTVEENKYSKWLRPIEDDQYKAYCTFYKSKFDIRHSGLNGVKIHGKVSYSNEERVAVGTNYTILSTPVDIPVDSSIKSHCTSVKAIRGTLAIKINNENIYSSNQQTATKCLKNYAVPEGPRRPTG
uniref:Uncharacterized protein n=1 Tax=Timema shepardi TaxID=629360 RepID=A0A7R9FZQ9_TIMSH|nr:unnamed protein product [Timema shepardi]